MGTNKILPFDESDNGKYIIVKIPRKTLYRRIIDPSTLFSDQRKYHRTLCTIGFIIIILVGMIVGSIFHDHILTINSDHATWKMFTMATKVQ